MILNEARYKNGCWGLGAGVVIAGYENRISYPESFNLEVLSDYFSGYDGRSNINFCYNYRYSKKMDALLPLLKQGDTEKYITEVELLRRKARGRFANHLLTINASGAYCRCKRYDKAVHLLEGLPAEALSGVFKLVYCINLCLCYFYQNQTDKAMALYESSQSIFHNYRNSKSYGGNIAVLDIHAAIGRRDSARAAEMLQKAKAVWNDDRFSDDYAELENIIHRLICRRNKQGIIPGINK